jgi:hypothetical protein
MRGRGVCYDVGRVMWGEDWRPEFSIEEARRELGIISGDLNCNVVRLCGQDLDRVTAAGEAALEQGLEVWLSPELWDRSPRETLEYVAEAAERAESLHRRRPGRVVLSIGSELTLFMDGIVEGHTVFERLEHPAFWDTVRSGAHNAPLNAFLGAASERARRVFHGRLTYASVPLESVDWKPFDIVSTDLYRDQRLRDGLFEEILGRYFAYARPVAITEFGCCTYRGAAAAGGRGFAIVDYPQDGKVPPHLNGAYVRDEAEQARELEEVLAVFDRAGVDAAFVMTFVAPLSPTSDDPRFDLDLASYSLVRSYGSRLGAFGRRYPDAPWERARSGVTYPDLPWEPKLAFHAVADQYAAQAGGRDA